VTDEKEDVVDKWIVTKKKTGYPIAILNGDLEKLLGVPHFPFAGVMDGEGNIIYAGDSAEGALKKAMKAAKPGTIWPKKLGGAATMLRNGKLGEGWAELQTMKSAGGLDDKEQKTLDRFVDYVTSASSTVIKTAQDLAKKDLVYLAVKKAEGIANAKPALPATEEAQKLLTDLKGLPNYDAEMKGGEAYAAAFAKEDAQEYLPAVEGYKKVAKDFESAKIAAVAMKRAQDLVSRGMPGYSPVCEKCQKQKKACEKHAKPVKL
jgi:hypothetical protein